MMSISEHLHSDQIPMSHLTSLVQKLWNYCNILRDDGHTQKEEGRMKMVEVQTT